MRERDKQIQLHTHMSREIARNGQIILKYVTSRIMPFAKSNGGGGAAAVFIHFKKRFFLHSSSVGAAAAVPLVNIQCTISIIIYQRHNE